MASRLKYIVVRAGDCEAVGRQLLHDVELVPVRSKVKHRISIIVDRTLNGYVLNITEADVSDRLLLVGLVDTSSGLHRVGLVRPGFRDEENIFGEQGWVNSGTERVDCVVCGPVLW